MEQCEAHQQLTIDVAEIKKDVKSLLDEQKKMNGRYDKHMEESVPVRDRLKILWFVGHAIVWLTGSGLIGTIAYQLLMR